jgi:urocanate hydratase
MSRCVQRRLLSGGDISFEERTRLLKEDQSLFKTLVDSTLKRHYHAIKNLIEKGTYFFDYGNAFLKSSV